ncbi:MAG: DUF3365 domain-containing protein [Bdellovibrionales bacterium]|nr:DUF3365 domain-containing protein [Bdellovibrionales bacterium]
MKCIGIILILFFATSGHAESKWSDIEASKVQEAKKVLMPLKKQLKGTLQTSVKEKGLMGAISACQIQAPQIQGELLQKGVKVGRTSHKLRSLANEPKDWMKGPLKEYAETHEGKKPAYQLVALENNLYGYLEPIYAKGMCLNCHGQNLKTEVAQKIKALYPKDQATGFKEGEFRGFFWAVLGD